MKKNTALKILVWVGVLIIANATEIGDVLYWNSLSIVAELNGENTGVWTLHAQELAYEAAHPDQARWAWWTVFGILTAFSILLGRVFVAIWGEKEAPKGYVPVAERDRLGH